MKNIAVFPILFLSVMMVAGELPVPKDDTAVEETNLEKKSGSPQDAPETNLETGKKDIPVPPQEEIGSLPQKPEIQNVNGKITEKTMEEVQIKSVPETDEGKKQEAVPEVPNKEIRPVMKKEEKEKLSESLPENTESKTGVQERARPREILKRHGEMVR